jgi:DNA-binding transcriptional MerR regulator
VADLREVYRTKDVVQILEISRRQLQYWAQTDLVVPSQRTQGGHHRYSFEDLVALKTAKRLIDAGVSVQRIRRAIRSLREILPTIEKPLTDLVLVATGDVVLAFVEGTVFEAVSGQEWVFEVAQFQRQIEAWRRATQNEEKKVGTTTGPVRTARSARRAQEQIRTA